MQTVETPSEQPEREFPEPMPVINLAAISGMGFYSMREMYRKPFEAYVPPNIYGKSSRHNIEKLAELSVLGYITVTTAGNGGFQLTALGRLVFHDYLQSMERGDALREERTKAARVTSGYERYGDTRWNDSFEPQPFDLDDF